MEYNEDSAFPHNGKKIRSRGENWTQQEKDLFLELVRQSAPIIENKLTDTDSNKRKYSEWLKIQFRLKKLTGKPRLISQLKGFWRRTKYAAKKTEPQYRQALQDTGGGQPPPSLPPDDLKIMEICPADFVMEDNIYDSDAVSTRTIRKNSTAIEYTPQARENEPQIDYQSESEIDEYVNKGTQYPIKLEHIEQTLCKDASEISFEECISSEPKGLYQTDLEVENRLIKESRPISHPKCNPIETGLPRDGAICNQEEDEFDTFGKHVASQLRKLSSLNNLLAQKEIQCTITKFRMEDIKNG